MAITLPAPATATDDLADPSLYLSRELAALEFNFRVLAMARDPRRAAAGAPALPEHRGQQPRRVLRGARGDAQAPPRATARPRPGPDGLPSGELLARIRDRALDLVSRAIRHLAGRSSARSWTPSGIHILTRNHWSTRQQRWLQGYFEHEVLPVLSPLGLDPAHPFPRILNKTLNIAVVLKGRDAFGHEGHMALVRAPRSLPRIIRVPAEVSGDGEHFVFLAELLQAFVDLMFPGFKVVGSYQFRVTRNSELIVEEAEVENLAHGAQRGTGRPRLCPPGAAGDRHRLPEGDHRAC